MVLSLFVFLSLCAGQASLTEEENFHNCSGRMTIPDINGELHIFSENQTELERGLRLHKRELVMVEGDCCFSIYSESQGAGQVQTFQSDGEHHLQIEVLRSVYLMEFLSSTRLSSSSSYQWSSCCPSIASGARARSISSEEDNEERIFIVNNELLILMRQINRCRRYPRHQIHHRHHHHHPSQDHRFPL